MQLLSALHSPRLSLVLRSLTVSAGALVLHGCAHVGAQPNTPNTVDAPKADAAVATAPAKPASKPADAGAPKPFDEVVKGATVQEGLFPIWSKDEKVWLEVPLASLNKPFLFTVNIANSVGERGMYASQMGTDAMVQWRRVGNQLQLLAVNNKFRAQGDNAVAVAQAFSPSLLASGAVASAEHPTRKAVLVDAALLLADIPGYSTRLEAAYRLPYSLDKTNSHFEVKRTQADLTTLTARVHFSTPRIPAPPLTPPPTPMPTPPKATPDPRSLFVSFVYSLSALPEQVMKPRRSDPRLGHFTESFTDLSNDLQANPRVHWLRRWRLEKQDPQAALSEPVRPIVYWLDKNIPVKYRAAVAAGVTAWNQAFERIGFKNAVQARQQADDADWDNMEVGHASIRWFVGADVGFAIGPHRADPRSGEILDADIGMSDVFARGSRRFIREDVAAGAHVHGAGHDGHTACNYAHEAAAEMHFAMDVLEARGDLAPDSPEAEAFVQSVITDTIMHEVGHTLGLKHNFKASTTVTRAQLQDKAYTAKYGISGSVMDYNAYNIALKGEAQASFNNAVLGPYDYWAIEYAYRPLSAAEEDQELARIAARSVEPALAYGDDAEAGGFGGLEGMDPLANRFDLGDEPLAYFQKRLQLSRELWDRLQQRKPQAGDEPLRQRRVLLAGFRQLHTAAELVGKYVGGMHALRDLPGTSQRASFAPVDPAQQRAALQFLATGLFSARAFQFQPEFMTRMGVDYREWDRDGLVDVRAMVLRSQTAALDRLLAPGTAQRLLDLPNYVAHKQRKNLISLHEVYATLQSSIWSELESATSVDVMRRGLQREHLKRVQTLLTRASPALPADATSLARLQAVTLQRDLGKALARGKVDVETRAHWAESLALLNKALAAQMQRS